MPNGAKKIVTTSLSISLNQATGDDSISAEIDGRPYGLPCNGLNQKKSFDPGDTVWILVFLPKEAESWSAYPSTGSCQWGGEGTKRMPVEELNLSPHEGTTKLTLSARAAGSVELVYAAPNNTTNIKSLVPAADDKTLYTAEPGRGHWLVQYDRPYRALSLTIPGDHNPKFNIIVVIEASVPSDEGC